METAVKKDPAAAGVILTSNTARRNILPTQTTGRRSFWSKWVDWETWHWQVKYWLIGPAWLWFCLRARSLWFFTASNPTITFGGFDGESKKEIYDQLPKGAHLPKYRLIPDSMPVDEVKHLLTRDGFTYPVAVKPDVGKMGLMFRKITCERDLETYHKRIGCCYIIQEWVSYPVEVSIFYYRPPGHTKGRITGFVRKDFMEVCGDGKSTLWELILRHPRAQLRLSEMKHKHSHKLSCVLNVNERYCLSHALNLSRGGKLVSLEHEKDEHLLRVLDQLNPEAFCYGRYDIKCSSVEDLKRGENYAIIEYNGSGAEPHHIYGNGLSLREACSELVAHWQILASISMQNNRAGVPYWSFWRGWKFMLQTGRHIKRLQRLDLDTELD